MNQGYQSISNLGSFYFIALAPTSNLVRRFEQKIVNEILEESDNNRLWAIGEKSNNLSILLVLMHTTLPISIIFGGDATKRVWEEALHAWPIMRKRLNKQKDVFDGVKISHHGAKDSLYPPLYERFCKPRKTIAILSAPPNDPSHPHEDVLKMLKQRGISVYATCWQTRLRPSVRTNLVFLGKPLKKTGDRSSMSLEYEWADIDVIIHSNGRLAVEPPESQIIKGDYDMTK